MRDRTPWLLGVVAAVVTTGVVGSSVAGHHVVRRGDGAASGLPPTSGAAIHARAVLRGWDHRRARAWARDDVAGLAALYVPGSATGRHDVAMLTAYRDRGLRVTGMSRQVLRLQVPQARRRRLTLLVTDRLVGARVVGRGVGAALPVGDPATRRVRLSRIGGRWRVVEVVGALDGSSPTAAAQNPRPAAGGAGPGPVRFAQPAR
jgi:hypothetical protein